MSVGSRESNLFFKNISLKNFLVGIEQADLNQIINQIYSNLNLYNLLNLFEFNWNLKYTKTEI